MSTLESRIVFDLHALLESTHTPHTHAQYPPDATLFMQGHTASTVLYIERGSVRLAMSSETGKEAICGVLGAGAFLSEGALCGDHESRHSAVAMTDVSVIAVGVDHLQQLLRTQTALLERFIDHMLARRSHLEADLADQIIHSSEQRLARALLQLAGCSHADAGPRALPRISQEHLARMVGTTRSRVNAFIGKFKRLGFIEAAGDALVVNPSRRHAAFRRHASARPSLSSGARVVF
jgi:CRP/FNR family transcriptional regulator, cyclic AMP receptor protein